MPDSSLQSLINYITDALSGNNSYQHSDSEFKKIILSDLRYQISELNPKINPKEVKRLRELFYQLENIGKVIEPQNNLVEIKRSRSIA